VRARLRHRVDELPGSSEVLVKNKSFEIFRPFPLPLHRSTRSEARYCFCSIGCLSGLSVVLLLSFSTPHNRILPLDPPSLSVDSFEACSSEHTGRETNACNPSARKSSRISASMHDAAIGPVHRKHGRIASTFRRLGKTKLVSRDPFDRLD